MYSTGSTGFLKLLRKRFYLFFQLVGLSLAVLHLFKDFIDLDEQGFIKVVPGTASTNLPGIFAAGDVADPVYRQGIVAAGSGAKAAIEADRYLQQL